MSATPSAARQTWSDRFHSDRIVLFGGSPRTLDLLRLAVIRSDNVLLIDPSPSNRVRHYAESFAVEIREEARPNDLAEARTLLVSIGDPEAENAIVRDARLNDRPVHVADRPLVSDFGLLEFLERRASTLRRNLAS